MVLPPLTAEIEVAAPYGSRGAEDPDRQQLAKPATDLLPGGHGRQVRLGESVLPVGPESCFRRLPVLEPAVGIGDRLAVECFDEPGRATIGISRH